MNHSELNISFASLYIPLFLVVPSCQIMPKTKKLAAASQYNVYNKDNTDDMY